jgi:hypothetical protein
MKKKSLILIIALLLVAVLASGAFALHRSQNRKAAYSTSGDASQKSDTKKSTSVTNPSSGSTSTSQTSGTVAVGTVPPPTNNDPYPITNEHYRINKTGDKQFDITLYAIINSPSQHDEYTAQLKQYKQEALAYLTSRYGSTAQFTFTWNPPAAKDL